MRLSAVVDSKGVPTILSYPLTGGLSRIKGDWMAKIDDEGD